MLSRGRSGGVESEKHMKLGDERGDGASGDPGVGVKSGHIGRNTRGEGDGMGHN